MSSLVELSKKFLVESVEGMGVVLEELKERSFEERARYYNKYTSTLSSLHEVVNNEDTPASIQDFLDRLPPEMCGEAIRALNEHTERFIEDFLKANNL